MCVKFYDVNISNNDNFFYIFNAKCKKIPLAHKKKTLLKFIFKHEF